MRQHLVVLVQETEENLLLEYVGSAHVQMQARHRRDGTVGVMWRNGDVISLRRRGDLSELRDATGVADVRLDDPRRVGFNQRPEVPAAVKLFTRRYRD